MHNTSEHVRHLAREWADIAHERDLSEALKALRVQFDRWERGEISAFELNDLVHRYHQDTARDIWKRYATNHLEPAVAAAVVENVLRRDELPLELLRHIARLIEFYEEEDRASTDGAGGHVDTSKAWIARR